MARCLLLYNPNSGKGALCKQRDKIVARLKSEYSEVDYRETASAEDLAEAIRIAADRYDAIVFSGGDGTFNNVIGALAGKRVQLGYIPSGTVNDVARSLGIPRTVRGAVNVILKGRSAELDCIRIGDRYAMYIAAAGAFTRATYETPQSRKRALGALAYAFEALRHNMDFDVFPVKITTEEGTVETSAVLVCVMNGRSVAGFPINRDGSMTDGVLEAVAIKQVQRPGPLRKFGALFSLASLFVFGCRIKKRDILYLSGRKIRIETADRVVWDFDGEKGFCGNAEIEVCPRRIALFVPKKKKI